MSLQKKLVVLLASCVVLTLAKTHQIRRHPAEASLLTFMSTSNDAMQNNPQRSVECFNYYIPLINEIAQTYEDNFKACLTASETAQTAAEAATADERDKLAQTVEATCAALTKCPDVNTTTTGIFQCYINEGSVNSKTLYTLSNNATVQLAALEESIRRIQSEENVCTTDTKIQYETQSAQAYADFNSCILGTSGVPTEAPTTKAPETTTAEPTTEQPIIDDSTPATDSPVEDNIDVVPEEDLFRFIRRFRKMRM